jgi:release factor glutamine methyltransferase
MIPATNRINDVKAWLTSELAFEKQEAPQLARMLLEDLLNISNQEIILGDKRISESQILTLKSGVKRLKQGEPIQHITETAFFHELRLKIDSRALIPRPETEELVELALEHVKGIKGIPEIIDICSGSGCIAMALKNKLPNSRVIGLEKSPQAIELSRENSAENHLEIEWLNQDVFEDHWALNFFEKFDLMVSNPPYIPHSDKTMMHARVLDHEPDMALFVENEKPLVYYERLADLSQKCLKTGGSLICEIHEDKGGEVLELFSKKGLKFVKVFQDLQGKNRMVCGTK